MGMASLPVVTIGNTAVPVTRVNDSTLSATAPIATGSFPVSVQLPQKLVSAGSVTLKGFEGEAVGPFMSGRAALINPGETNPLVLSYGDSGVVVVDLNANAVVASVPDSVASPDCTMSPGPSYRGPTYFVVQGEVGGVCRYSQVWNLYPTVSMVDSTPIYVWTWYVMAEVGPKRWFAEYNNHTAFWSCDSQPCTYNTTMDVGAYAVTMNPSDSRFIFTPSSFPGSTGGPPSVFNVTSLDTAMLLPGNGSVITAQYSGTADTMFVFGQAPSATPNSQAPMHLTAVRSDGVVVRDQPLDSLGYGGATQLFNDVAAPASSPYIYALTGYTVDTTVVPTLVVLDRATWTVVGVAMAKGVSANTVKLMWYRGGVWVIPAPALHKVFVVAQAFGYNMHQTHSAILTFDTP